jgi:hypothetical protein
VPPPKTPATHSSTSTIARGWTTWVSRWGHPAPPPDGRVEHLVDARHGQHDDALSLVNAVGHWRRGRLHEALAADPTAPLREQIRKSPAGAHRRGRTRRECSTGSCRRPPGDPRRRGELPGHVDRTITHRYPTSTNRCPTAPSDVPNSTRSARRAQRLTPNRFRRGNNRCRHRWPPSALRVLVGPGITDQRINGSTRKPPRSEIERHTERYEDRASPCPRT